MKEKIDKYEKEKKELNEKIERISKELVNFSFNFFSNFCLILKFSFVLFQELMKKEYDKSEEQRKKEKEKYEEEKTSLRNQITKLEVEKVINKRNNFLSFYSLQKNIILLITFFFSIKQNEITKLKQRNQELEKELLQKELVKNNLKTQS